MALGLRERVERLAGKRVSRLSGEERELLRAYYLGRASEASVRADLKRRAKRVPARVGTWLRRPNRYDIPGVDTPGSPRRARPRSLLERIADAVLERLRREGFHSGWRVVVYPEGMTAKGVAVFRYKAYLNGKLLARGSVATPGPLSASGFEDTVENVASHIIFDINDSLREKGYWVKVNRDGDSAALIRVTDKGVKVLHPEPRRLYRWHELWKLLEDHPNPFVVLTFKHKALKHGWEYPLETVWGYAYIVESKKPIYSIILCKRGHDTWYHLIYCRVVNSYGDTECTRVTADSLHALAERVENEESIPARHRERIKRKIEAILQAIE